MNTQNVFQIFANADNNDHEQNPDYISLCESIRKQEVLYYTELKKATYLRSNVFLQHEQKLGILYNELMNNYSIRNEN